MALQTIKGVEVFAAGTWNGDTYTEQDLDKMCEAYRATKNLFRPYLKLGHNPDQKLLQKDGLPAAGWIGEVYRMGSKLMADFVDIPEKIFDLIKNKAYRKVSSEVYWNIVVDGVKYPYLLGAVALLGADTPAVTNLADILSMYGIKFDDKIKIYTDGKNADTVKEYSFKPQPSEVAHMKTEAEIALELKLKAEQEAREKLAGEVKTFAKANEDKDAEIAALKADKQKSEKAAADAVLAAEQTKRQAFVNQMVAEKTITPAMKPLVEAFLGEDKKEYSIKVAADKDEQKFSKETLLKEILKLHSATSVNRKEGSEEGQEPVVKNSDDAIEAKIQEYMTENKVPYRQAYSMVTRDMKPRASKTLAAAADA